MVKYIVFTQEELDAIKAGDDVKSIDQDGHLVIYTNEEKYTKMGRSCSECKRIDTCEDKIDARNIDDDIKYGMVVPNYIPGPNAECLVEDRSCR